MNPHVPPDQFDPLADRREILRDDTVFAIPRIVAFQWIAVAVFLFLLISYWDIQVRNPEFYAERAERNRIRSVPIPAARGRIFDRDGRVIVDSHLSFQVHLHTENVKDEHLKFIADGLNLDLEELRQKIAQHKGRPKYETVMIKQDLTPGDVAFVDSHRGESMFPELTLIHGQQRLYPRGGLGAHVLGYVGEVTENELNSPQYAAFEQGDIVGKVGIEKEYNEILQGIDGQQQWVVDTMGTQRYALPNPKEAVAGKDITLSLDLDLQVVAELALETRRGAIVALDPRNGEVLAMASRPSFDLNQFTGRIKATVWDAIRNDPYTPMLNRAIQAQQAPGSTFKPIEAIAGLEEGVVTDDTVFSCGGGQSFYGRPFKCHSVHGATHLHRALTHSCDVFFYNVGNILGIDRIFHYGDMSGLGKKTGIDLPNEATGLMPSSAWKMRAYRQKWFAGETISVSIGQGYMTVTPLQLAHAVGGIAVGGVWHKPHLLKNAKVSDPRKGNIKPENVKRVVDGMWGVVNEGGTGARSQLPGIDFCGKTGTAQLASLELVKRNRDLGEVLGDNAWFVGFAPRDNPEIAVAALYENGLHGDRAAPLVRDVIKAYFDKKARKAAQAEKAKLEQGIPSIAAFVRPPVNASGNP